MQIAKCKHVVSDKHTKYEPCHLMAVSLKRFPKIYRIATITIVTIQPHNINYFDAVKNMHQHIMHTCPYCNERISYDTI